MAEDTASVRGAASPGTRSTTCTSTAPPNGRPPDTHLDDPGGLRTADRPTLTSTTLGDGLL